MEPANKSPEHNKHDKVQSNMCRLTALWLIINNHSPWPKWQKKARESGDGPMLIIEYVRALGYFV